MTDIHIEALTRERAPQACRVLAHAFVTNPLNAAAFGPSQLARNEAFFRVGLAAMKGTKLVATDGSQMRSWCLALPTNSCGAKPHPRGGSRQQMVHERACGSSSSPWSC